MRIKFQGVSIEPERLVSYILHILILLTLLFLVSCSKKVQSDKDNQIGQQAPSFTLKDLNGANFSINNLKGRVILLRFWATRCESCKVEMPKLDSVYRTLLPSGFMVLAINVEDPAETATAFANELKLTYPILLDENKEVTKLYNVYGVPTSFVIDRKGVIRERVFGDLTEEAVESLVRPFL